MYVETLSCGPYELVAQDTQSLREEDDGSGEVRAESRYLVRLDPGANPKVLAGSLSVPHGGKEGILRFGNFIGVAELGGRRLKVVSDRLADAAVDQMLDEVARRLASLPFGAMTPTAAPYLRGRELGPDALYHAFAFLRDAMRARGPHDLAGAVRRILARPYESLRADEQRLTPLAYVTSVDAATLAAIQSAPELLAPVTSGSLKRSPLARSLQGCMPSMVRVVPLAQDNDTVENRFVVAALDAMGDVARRFERLSRASGRAASAVNAREAREMAHQLERWRRHHVLERLQPNRSVPLHSTVLRGRAGYREVLSTYLELLARTRVARPHDLQRLLELRDAALIYEYWCYFNVVSAVTQVLSLSPTLSRFSVDELGSRVPYGYRAMWDGVEAVYNATFSPDVTGNGKRGEDSYSVPLRPDITMRTAGRLHIFDAKLKLDVKAAFKEGDTGGTESEVEPSDPFKRGDLDKMHTYRDALGADSVWILYPGSEVTPQMYEVPWSARKAVGFQGVGAVALRPGAPTDGGLSLLLQELLSQEGSDD